MARKLIYEVVLDSAAYTRQIKKVQAETTAFATSTQKTSREISRMTRGAAVGSGAFKGLGRSLAFASGGFLAFEGGTKLLRDSIDAAYEGQKAQRSLAAQMKASGESFAANNDEIEHVARSYSRFGFSTDAVTQSLTVLERATGNINQAIQLQGVTANLARAKNIDLAAAAAIVGKVFGGQETALRRAVPGLSKHAHGLELIRQASQRLAGQAAANTTAQEKFNASLHNAEVSIGTLLLPAMDSVLKKATTGADAMTKFGDSMHKSGSDANELAFGLGKVWGQLKNIDSQAQHNKTWGIGRLATPIWGTLTFGPKALANAIRGIRQMTQDPSARAPTGAADAAAKAAHGVGLAAANAQAYTVANKPATVAQRNQWFDAMVGRRELRAGLLAGAAAQLAAYKAIGRILTARIAATHDITRKLSLEDQGLQNAATVAGLQTQIAADLKQKQADTAQKIKDQIDAARQEKMGWLDFAIERAQATKTVKDDLAAFRAKEKFLQGLIRTEGRTLELVSELWRVRQQIRDLNKKNGADAKDPLAGLFQVSSRQLTNILAAGTGLGAAGRRRLGFNIAGAEIQPVHVHLNLDGREVASVVAKHQARAGNRTTKQTSGRRG